MEALEVKVNPKYPFGILLTGQCFEEDAPFESYTGYIRNEDGTVKVNGENLSPPEEISTFITEIVTIGEYIPGEVVRLDRLGTSSNTRIFQPRKDGIHTSGGSYYLYSDITGITKLQNQASYFTSGHIFELENGDIKWATSIRVLPKEITLHRGSSNSVKQVRIPNNKIKLIGYRSDIPTSFNRKFKEGDEIFIVYDSNIESPYKTFTVKQVSRNVNSPCIIIDVDGKEYSVSHNTFNYMSSREFERNAWNRLREEDLKIQEIQKKLKDPEFIKNTLDRQLDSIKSIMLLVHGEDYVDVTYTITNSPQMIINAVVWYPELEITNSNDHKHTIKDLYVRFQVNYNIMTDTLKMSGVNGLRRSFTKDEVLSKYAHSHLSNYYHTWQNFCLGETDTADMVGSLCNKFDSMQFQALLYIMNSYVKWESLEGGPYIRMSSLLKNNSRSLNANLTNSVPEGILKEIVNNIEVRPKLDLINGEFRVVLTSELEENIIKILLRTNTNFLAKRVPEKEIYYYYEGNASTNSNQFEQNKSRLIRDQESFTFKDKEIKVKIIEEIEEDDENNLIVCINPQVRGRILEYLSLLINEFILTE